jgi:hypothetical protein
VARSIALRAKGLVDLEVKRDKIRKIRKNRYGRAETPEGILQSLKQMTRIFSGLSNNEIGRVSTSLTRNFPELLIPAADDDQQKFFNAFLAFQEKYSGQGGGIIYPTIDSMAEASIAFWEWYVDPDVEELELTQRPDETSQEYKKRVTPLLRKAGPILRARQLDVEACTWDPLAENLPYLLISEWKEKPILRRELMSLQGDPTDEDDPRLPGEHDRGQAYQAAYAAIPGTGKVETIRYWDEKWYGYWVDGVEVECVPHGFATIPISIFPGKVTGTANPADRTQGIVDTLYANEFWQDTLLTKAVDDRLTFGSPKVALFADKDTLAMPPGDDGHVPTVDLSDPRKTPYLAPGYKVGDAYGGFRINEDQSASGSLMSFWNRAAMNEVSSGSAPGADVAGYTVNALQTASLTNYGPFITNLQHGIERAIEKIVRPFFQSLGIPVSIPSPLKSAPWLTLKPEKIDDTPVTCTISPLADIQKMQITQLLAQLKNGGVISGYTAAEASPMVADPELEEKRKDLEAFHAAMLPRSIEDAMQQLYGPLPPPPAGGPGAQPLQGGGAPPPSNGPAGGDARPTNTGEGMRAGVPAPPAPPTNPGGGGQVMTAGAMRGGLPHQMGQ